MKVKQLIKHLSHISEIKIMYGFKTLYEGKINEEKIIDAYGEKKVGLIAATEDKVIFTVHE